MKPLKQELQEIRSYGYAFPGLPPRWLRGPATFDGEMLRMDSATAELYWPSFEENLPYSLAGVQRSSEAIEFIRKYGLLWHGPGSSDFSESWAEWKEEIARLQVLMQLYNNLREATAGTPGDAIEELRAFFEMPSASDTNLIERADQAIAGLVAIGRKKGGVELSFSAESVLEGGEPCRFVNMAIAETLLGYAYYHLGLTLSARVQLLACQECNAFFEVRDPRQKYCNERCSYRSRYRTLKAKKDGGRR